VGVVTSAEADLELSKALPDTELQRIPSPSTTTFENRTTPSGRMQWVKAVARRLRPDDVPPAWRRADVVHLGPVAQECDPALALVFKDAFLGLTPQGWMRRWDDQGRVHSASWTDAKQLLPHADAVVLSEEDLVGEEETVARWATMTPTLVLTRGAHGCSVYSSGERRDVPGFPAVEIDPTGAGDVFAAVLFTTLARGVDPWQSARLANAVAAVSVTRPGLEGVPTPAEILRCRARFRS
jgi:sugar/nucleoside kinase (ribokinase family)